MGIDYGMGKTNIDTTNGIRYGVISMNALAHWAWEDFESDYGDPTCPECGNDALSEYDDDKHGQYPEHNGCDDYACEHCELLLDSSDVYGDETIGHNLDSDGYKGFVDSYNDVMLVRSPYFTRADFCSPCAPGAGHLENYNPNGVKTYCLGHDWFEERVAPYPVYSVETGAIVEPETV